MAVIPVLNKIDLGAARPDELTEKVVSNARTLEGRCPLGLAKEGEGIEAVLEEIYKKIPPPRGELHGELRAQIFDSHYDSYRGVIVYIRMIDGVFEGMRIELLSTGARYEVNEVGVFKPKHDRHREPLRGGGRRSHPDDTRYRRRARGRYAVRVWQPG